MTTYPNVTPTLYCATVLYPYQADIAFDFDQYVNILIPSYIEILSNNCVRYEIRKGLSSPDNPNPDFICIASFWVKSMEKFNEAVDSPGMHKVLSKIAVCTKIQPIRQFDQVIT